eukprot:SAG31_NODE_32624_length_353_cov_1.007874_1_plen_30_part_10
MRRALPTHYSENDATSELNGVDSAWTVDGA